jgi:heptosyltransferase-2
MTDAEIESGRQIITQYNLDSVQNLYMISLLGSSYNKTYPYEYMAQLLDVIAQKEDVYDF